MQHGYIHFDRNSLSVSQNLTLDKKDKVKHYIRRKTHSNIALKFLCKSGV